MKAIQREEAPPVLALTTGAMALPVVRDGTQVGELVLHPDDTEFLARFFDLLPLLETRRTALQARLGEEVSPGESVAALRETCSALRGDIDDTFGAGTSDLVFGTVHSLALVQQFFAGVADALHTARAPKLAAYTQSGDDVLR